jgi:methionine-rich copper-binding protein CopC
MQLRGQAEAVPTADRGTDHRVTAGRALPAAALLWVLVDLAVATPAAGLAAGGLTGSDPPDRAALASPPAAVELTFSSPPDVSASHVRVLDDSGSPVNSAPATRARGNAIRQPVGIAGAGNLTVAYHALLADGSEASGLLRFSVGTGVPPPALGGGVREAVEAAAVEAAGGEHGHGIDPFSAVLLAVNGLVVVGVVLLLFLRRPRFAAERGERGPPG